MQGSHGSTASRAPEFKEFDGNGEIELLIPVRQCPFLLKGHLSIEDPDPALKDKITGWSKKIGFCHWVFACRVYP